MENATILTPPSFPPEPNIHEGPEYEKISTLLQPADGVWTGI